MLIISCIFLSVLIPFLNSKQVDNPIYNVDHSKREISAVVVTAGKDSKVFLKSIENSLNYLTDVNLFYIICPHPEELKKKMENTMIHNTQHKHRVVFINDNIFPFNANNVSQIMIETVKQRALYPLDGSSPFEKMLWGKSGWFLQQLLKFYAGSILNLTDYVILDADVVWFQETKFIASNHQYYYASSCQYHAPYLAVIPRITGCPLFEDQPVWRSGIVHHMVFVRYVLESLITTAEKFHGIPFWKILLNVSALEMTCRAPKTSICGAGSTLSEYELYFNYARKYYPETVSLRPLLWTNGPAPGLLYKPDVRPPRRIVSDSHKQSWASHRQSEVVSVLEKQMLADAAQGYHFVGYHSYAKRRYSEMVGGDLKALCGTATVVANTTCSWNGYELSRSLNLHSVKIKPDDWFRGCACYLSYGKGV